MAKDNSREEARVNNLAYVLELLGSMLYIIAAIYVMSSFSGFIGGTQLYILASSGFWLPIFYSLAVVGTVLLFVVSFINLMRSRSRVSKRYAMVISILTGTAWIGLSAGNAFLTILVMLGFVVSLVGSAFGMLD